MFGDRDGSGVIVGQLASTLLQCMDDVSRWSEANPPIDNNDNIVVDDVIYLDKIKGWRLVANNSGKEFEIKFSNNKNPEIIIFDEATSALDENSQQFLYQQLIQLAHSQNGAFVSITHQANLIALHPIHWKVEDRTVKIQNAFS